MENVGGVGYWIGILLGGFMVGAICGILPLVFALKRGKCTLAVVSWVSCVVAGLVLGIILALPVAIIFTVVIVCLKKSEVSSEARGDKNSGGTVC